MAQNQETLGSFAAKITQQATIITSYFNEHNLQTPSFAASNEAEYPAVSSVQIARLELIESLMDMLQLAIGGNEYIFMQSMALKHDTAVINVLNQFDFFSAVPVDGSASYTEISRAVQLPESIVRRILRHAMTMRLFSESPPGSGQVVHSAATAHVVKHPLVRSWIAHNMEEVEPACGKLPEALKKFSMGKLEATEEVDETPFGLSHLDEKGKPMTFWQFIQSDGQGDNKGYREPRFAEAMQIASRASNPNSEIVRQGFDWAGLGKATVVDVGGSSGHEAVALARKFSDLSFIIQDMPTVEQAFQDYVPTELNSRVSFQAHDFFNPQTVAADVYFLKGVLHDWPDKYAINIMRALLPAMRPGARIIIYETCLQPQYNSKGEKTMPLPIERMMTTLDLQMLVTLNAKERTVDEWESLFLQADQRLKLASVKTFPGTAWGLIEVVFGA